MMTGPTLEERTSRLEGGYDHLATKADLERVRVDLERLRAQMERRFLQLGIAMVSAMGVIAGVVLAVIKLT